MAQAIARKRHQQGSPVKMRLVLNEIRGKKVQEALSMLHFMTNRASNVAEQTLRSALANFQLKDENRSIDVSIIDVPWNGLAESYKISTMAEAYEINCAPHNFYGHMSTLMSANLCAAMPNFRIMEIDIDDVPWKDDLVTHPPVIENGELIVPTRPGWGADINEEAVKAHPPKNPHP